MSFVAGNLVGAVAVILSLIGLQQNTDKKFLFFQIIINLLYTLQYFLLGATAGLGICLINTIRCIVFYLYKKKELHSIWLFLFFVGVYLFLGIYTLDKPFDIILMIGTLIYTYSLWQTKMVVIRTGSLVSIISYIVYNVAVNAYSALLLDFIDFISISIAIIRYDILKLFKRRS